MAPGDSLADHARHFVRVFLGVLCAAATLALPGCVSQGPALTTVAQVDLSRYVGRWYEIARYPVSFEEGCTGVTADYTLREDGRVEVVNTCRRDSLTGESDQARGTARVADRDTNAKLKVTFFWPFEGDYWVIDLDEAGYEWAVVGEPRRKMLWVLGRSPQLPPGLYADITARLPDKGYDASKLMLTEQPSQ